MKTWLVSNIVKVIGIILSVIVGFFTGTTRKTNEQINEKLNFARENQKFKQSLDAVSVADKRKFLQKRFPQKK